jgi:hypothetical protein
MLLATALLLVGEETAYAQKQPAPITGVRAPEVFGHVGHFRAGSDEGAVGTASSYGAALIIPVAPHFALEADVQTSRVAKTQFLFTDRILFEYVTRRTLVLPRMTYRFGRDTVSGLVGGGVGVEFDANTTRVGEPLSLPGDQEVLPGVFERSQSRTSVTLSVNAGVIAFPAASLGVRGDVFLANYSVGIRMGLGYRFR